MSESEQNDPIEDPILGQVEEKVKMTQMSLDFMTDLYDRLETHFSNTD